MKITFLNEINYHMEAMSVISAYVKKEPYYEKIKEGLRQKYNIPMDELDNLYEEISNIYDFVSNNIDIPKDKLDFYFSYNDDESPSLGYLLMSFTLYNDDEATINNFLELSTQEKLKRYLYLLNENTDYGLLKVDYDNFNDKYYVNYINNSNFETNTKLKYILLYYNLEDYLKEINDIINKVIVILKKKHDVLQYIADEYQRIMSEEVEKYGDKLLENYDFKVSIDKDIVIKPLIIRANTLMLKPWFADFNNDILDKRGAYIGIHVKILFDLINIYFINDEKIISTLKALGDKSKFDILKSIKDTQMYGVEIAKKLNITTATVSHHMSNLYNLSLINYVADNNKMNYMLNKEAIEELINALENLFLK